MTRTVLTVLAFALIGGCAPPDLPRHDDASASSLIETSGEASLHHDPAQLNDLFEHVLNPAQER